MLGQLHYALAQISLPAIFTRAWMRREPIYCLRDTRYENLDVEVLHLARCSDCDGVVICDDELMFESDCIRCVSGGS